MQRTSFAEFHCSLARALDVVGEWWSPLVVARVALGLHRFDDLHLELGVSRKVLASRLDTLVDHGVLERRPYQTRPVRHEYVLTEKGADLVPALMALMAWGDRWTDDGGGPPLALRHRRCGQDAAPQVTCPRCSEPMTHEDVVAHAGPGSRVGPGTRLSAERLRVQR
jgi:DNA-binding HxlR family transcriptional regulator